MRSRRSPIIALTILALTLSGGATHAQDEPPGGDAETAAGDIVAMLPAELGGEPIEFTIQRGPESIENLDPDDPAQAEQIADIEAMLEATGASIDDLAIATGVLMDEAGSGFAVLVQGVQVTGVDEGLVRDVVLELVISAWEQFGEGAELRREDQQIAGRDVLALVPADPPQNGAEEAGGLYFYVSGDTAWVVSAADHILNEILDLLP